MDTPTPAEAVRLLARLHLDPRGDPGPAAEMLVDAVFAYLMGDTAPLFGGTGFTGQRADIARIRGGRGRVKWAMLADAWLRLSACRHYADGRWNGDTRAAALDLYQLLSEDYDLYFSAQKFLFGALEVRMHRMSPEHLAEMAERAGAFHGER